MDTPDPKVIGVLYLDVQLFLSNGKWPEDYHCLNSLDRPLTVVVLQSLGRPHRVRVGVFSLT